MMRRIPHTGSNQVQRKRNQSTYSEFNNYQLETFLSFYMPWYSYY